MKNLMVPTDDLSNTGWDTQTGGAVDLHSTVDEQIADDTDFIHTASSGTVSFKLSTPNFTPTIATEHKIHLRLRQVDTQDTLSVSIKVTGTTMWSKQYSGLSSTFTDYTEIISAAQAAMFIGHYNEVTVQCSTGTSVPDELLADFVADFEQSQGNPWYYIYRFNDDTGETPMTPSGTNLMVGLGVVFCRADGHAGPDIGYKAVRRWIAPSAMRIRIVGYFGSSQAGGDGTAVRILKNTTVLFNNPITLRQDGSIVYNIVVDTAFGDKIDFEAGSRGVDASFDDVYWDCQIYSTSAPLT